MNCGDSDCVDIKSSIYNVEVELDQGSFCKTLLYELWGH